LNQAGRIVILGAGPCGLGAAHRLRELGHEDFAVYERAAEPGGLAASVRDDKGFVWDYGCHVLYSRSGYFNGIMDTLLDGAWIEQPRDAQVWIEKRFVPYPLQYNVHRLPPEVCRECVLGLARAATRSPPPAEDNFRDWIVNAFGEGIAAHFMIPYNEKVWAHPLETMDVAWIAERVPRPELTRVLANLLDAKDDDAWGPNARFRYPEAGGTGAIWRDVAGRIGSRFVHYRRTAVAIDPKRRRVLFEDGGEDSYDVLISTLPLDRLVALARLDSLVPAARALSSSTVHVVGLGVEGDLPAALAGRKWIYFPDLSLPFYRATVLSNFAPSNAPPGHWSLLAEAAASEHRPIDPATVVDAVIAGFTAEGFIPPGQRIVSRFHHVAEPGYPTPTLARNDALARLHPALAALGIHSRGRFGAWRYEIANQDHSFLQGAELAGHLVAGEVETTFRS
jgi:protoporphyrinogen oxidase